MHILDSATGVWAELKSAHKVLEEIAHQSFIWTFIFSFVDINVRGFLCSPDGAGG